MLLGTLGASFLGNILTCKGINRAGEGHGQEIVCTGYGSNSRESKKKKNSSPSSFIDKYWNENVLSKWS